MSQLKRLFGMPWVMLVFAASIHTAVMLFVSDNQSAWVGAALALWPILFFFGALMGSGKGRAPATMTLQLVLACAGTLWTLLHFETVPFIYSSLIGVTGILLYDYWYSVMPTTSNTLLQLTKSLPEFQVQGDEEKLVSSQQWIGKPLLLMFIRGNWCPLCVAQVKELAEHYQQMAARGIQIIIVSGQPAKETRELAKMFSVPFSFYSDLGGVAAKKIGIQHEQGTPLGMVRYSTDTVIPTVVICDVSGVIRYVDIAENYRDRPEPELLLKELGI